MTSRPLYSPGVAASVVIGNGGWIRYDDEEVENVLVRLVEDKDGRLRISELYLAPGRGGLGEAVEQGLRTEMLRKLKLGRIEGLANRPDLRDDIVEASQNPGPDLHRAAAYFTTTVFSPIHWVARSLAAQHPESDEPQAPYPEPIYPDPTASIKNIRRRSLKLKVPKGPKYPDSFYKRLAELYGYLSRVSSRPVADLAEANEVPKTTVHRWIKEARRRGLLGKGRRGKVG
jgi:hypothetical protein